MTLSFQSRRKGWEGVEEGKPPTSAKDQVATLPLDYVGANYQRQQDVQIA